jgi:hypothetical protein
MSTLKTSETKQQIHNNDQTAFQKQIRTDNHTQLK